MARIGIGPCTGGCMFGLLCVCVEGQVLDRSTDACVEIQ